MNNMQLIYVKFPDKDTERIMKCLSKVGYFRPGSSMMIKEINPIFQSICEQLYRFVAANRILAIDHQILQHTLSALQAFAKFNFSTERKVKQILYKVSYIHTMEARLPKVGEFESFKIVLYEDLVNL